MNNLALLRVVCSVCSREVSGTRQGLGTAHPAKGLAVAGGTDIPRSSTRIQYGAKALVCDKEQPWGKEK